MKVLTYCLFPLSFLFLFFFTMSAQTIPTTIKEIYGNNFVPGHESSPAEISAAMWESKLNLPYSDYYGASFTDGDKLIIAGGDVTGSGVATSMVTSYNINTNTYSQLPVMSLPLRLSTGVELKGKYHIFGGYTNGNSNPLDVHLEYDLGTSSWSSGVSMSFGKFYVRALKYKDEGIYTIGGSDVNSNILKNVDFFNPLDQTFHPATDLPSGTADGGAAMLNDEAIIIIGGFRAGFDSPVQVDSVFIGEINPNDPTDITWTVGPNFPGGPRARINAYSWGYNQVIVVGGTDNETFSQAYSDVWVYNHNSRSWSSWTQKEDKPTPMMAYQGGSFSLPNDVWKLAIIGGITTGPALSNVNEVYTDTIPAPSGVEIIDSAIPKGFQLTQNYPNPFNPSTTIQFSIPEQTFVNLEIYNSLGEKISNLVSGETSAGNYKYEWNAPNLPSGIYFYTLTTDNFRETKKSILLK